MHQKGDSEIDRVNDSQEDLPTPAAQGVRPICEPWVPGGEEGQHL